jgi:hypothetical protein
MVMGVWLLHSWSHTLATVKTKGGIAVIRAKKKPLKNEF